jgi:hypothetical protein
MTPILEMRKQRLSLMKSPAQGHLARKWQKQDSNQVYLVPHATQDLPWLLSTRWLQPSGAISLSWLCG